MISGPIGSERAASADATAPMPVEAVVRAALEDVHDPEIPQVSVVDLGVVHRVEVAPGRIRVELLPTFVGCPAVDLMRQAVVDRLRDLADRVEVTVTFAVPWTSDRITPEGRRKLRRSGFAPPPRSGDGAEDDDEQHLAVLPIARCPHCGSFATTLENPFGPTLCRAIHHCSGCRQPFEAFKPV